MLAAKPGAYRGETLMDVSVGLLKAKGHDELPHHWAVPPRQLKERSVQPGRKKSEKQVMHLLFASGDA